MKGVLEMTHITKFTTNPSKERGICIYENEHGEITIMRNNVSETDLTSYLRKITKLSEDADRAEMEKFQAAWRGEHMKK